MIEEATVDAYGDEEQLVGFCTMIADYLDIPFETEVFGLRVTVRSIDLLPGSGIVAVCTHGRFRQAIGILDLPLPSPAPKGAEWIEAYRHWAP
ncbi:calcium-binding protein [Nocardia sp. NBC_01388]